MDVNRTIAHAPRTRALAAQMETLRGPCIGCKGCQGICAALIEAMILPEILLAERTA